MPTNFGDLLLFSCRLGKIDTRPGYHSRTQLWPVGYHATWKDAAAGTFQCDIAEGNEEGPLFTVSLQPAEAGQAQQVQSSLCKAQCGDTV